MKIIKLSAENIKKLRAVEITPQGDVIQITGKNAQGKTSVLDSIWMALAGAKAIQKSPIRKGENKARIKLDLGEVIVERTFTEKGTTLTVTNEKGAKFKSPQSLLDSLLGELSFDPLAFARMDPKKQYDELRRVSKLEIDIEELEALNRTDYDKRRDINRDAKAKRAQAEGLRVPPGTPDEPVDEAQLLDELQRVADFNAKIENEKSERNRLTENANNYHFQYKQKMERVRELREQADELEKEAKELQTKSVNLTDEIKNLDPIPEYKDVAELRSKLDDAKSINVEVEKRKRKDEIIEEAKALEQQAQVLTERMEARENAKVEAIKKAQMPVEGLSFGDGIVTYNGIPFEQTSDSEKLKVSLGIAMAANPKIRVIRIENGSLLDSDSLGQIANMAKEKDCQIWIEQVEESGAVGVVIDDGSVIKENYKEDEK